MEEHGLIARRFYSDHPPRAEYLLTDKGKELGMVVGALAVWGARHVHPETSLVHTACGEPVQLGTTVRTVVTAYVEPLYSSSGRDGEQGERLGLTDNARYLDSMVYESLNRYLVFINSLQQTISDYPVTQ